MDELTKAQERVLDFLRGEFQSGRPTPTHREIARHFGFRSSRAAACHLAALKRKGYLSSQARMARSLSVMPQLRRHCSHIAEIPLFGSIPAGFAETREQPVPSYIAVDLGSIGFTPNRNTFALRVAGSSMIGRHILDGDIVIAEYGLKPNPGQVVVALIDQESTLKTFVLKDKKAFLKAENPNYSDLIPLQELMIQGVLRAVIRKA